MKTKMKISKVYEFGSKPLKLAEKLVDGKNYVTSSGDVYKWVNGVQDFEKVLESPLDLTLENNTMENLTETQLKLFWKLCK
jgi:hypothetical protein